MATPSEIISAMREAAPPGQQQLDDGVLGELRSLTQALIAARPDASDEYARFLALGQRGIAVPEAELAGWLGGASVLVTGGTGCIGSKLMAQIARWRPRAAGQREPRRDRRDGRACPGSQYVQADIRDRRGLAAVFGEVRPDVVFHMAAQRDPGLAEREVYRTVTTNVLGTGQVIAAAEEAGASQRGVRFHGQGPAPILARGVHGVQARRRMARRRRRAAAASSPARRPGSRT